MPELPDVQVYVERLSALYGGQRLAALRIKSPFLLRSVEVSPQQLTGQRLLGVERMGKRLVFDFGSQLYVVLHLMIAGRLHRKPLGVALNSKSNLCAWDFEDSSLLLTEAGTQRRASLHIVRGAQALLQFDRGGIEPLLATAAEFMMRLRSENRTLKRALTDPRLLSGIGNAYSDEILHAARLSPVTRTRSLSDEDLLRLFEATRAVLRDWTERTRKEVGDGFPSKVTAFRPGMAVHGRFGEPCPVCGTKVQRIRFANNELNYCPSCQTQGKLLADRGLSRLLKGDWPKTLEELEELKEQRR